MSKVISRDRFLFSKLYFADPVKPANASHTYFVDELVNEVQEKRSRDPSVLNARYLSVLNVLHHSTNKSIALL